MTTASVPSTWLWIPKTWAILYSATAVLGLIAAYLVNPTMYSVVMLVVVPVVLIPLTYKNLVDGACSLRFRMCGFVKGILAGLLFLVLTLGTNLAVWVSLSSAVGLSPLVQSQLVSNVYWVWFFSGALGGIGARVAEIRHRGT